VEETPSTGSPPAQILGRASGEESLKAAKVLMAPWDLSGSESTPSPKRKEFVQKPDPPPAVSFGATAEDTFSFVDEPASEDTEKAKKAFAEKQFSFCEEQPAKEQPRLSSSYLQGSFDKADSVKKPGRLSLDMRSKASGSKVQGRMLPSTTVRLPRLSDLPTCLPTNAASKATASMLGLPVPEYAALLTELQARQSRELLPMAKSMARWYLPFAAFMGFWLLLVLLLADITLAVPLCVPLFVLLPGLLAARMWQLDRQLAAAVDHAASADARDQLRAPLGWGEGGELFSANLSAALQAAKCPADELLLCPPVSQSQQQCLSIMFSLALLGVPAVLSVARAASAAPGLLEAEVSVLVLSLLLVVVFVCRPQEQHRPALVNSRLEALECAFNALLDTLRPLLGQHSASESGGRQGRVVSACTEGSEKASNERFAVRLISAERQTLRGNLSVVEQPWDASQEAPSFRMVLRCPLTDLELVATGLEGALPCELGRCAAGDADFSISRSPSGQEPGLGLPSWASGLASQLGPGPPGRRRRQDDEMSTSLASVSTASTLKRDNKNAVDEASLHLALGMVTAMTSRRGEPLEVFRGLLPPKALADEASLILAVAGEHLSFSRGRSTISKDEDRFGVVREPSEIRQLCEDQACEEGRGLRQSTSIAVDEVNFDSPRSSAASQGTSASDAEEDELAACDSPSKWPSSPGRRTRYSKLFNAASHHVAVVFDSFSARDTCLARLRAYLPMPVPSEAPSPSGAASRGNGGLLVAAVEASSGRF